MESLAAIGVWQQIASTLAERVMHAMHHALNTYRAEVFYQGEKAHAGVFKSSPSRMSDELTGTCSSQECSRRARCHMGSFPTHGQVPHGPSAGGPGQSPHIPQGKGVPIGRFATQTRHSGSDTSSVARVGVCMAHDDEKSSRSVMRSQTAPVCGEGKRPGSTHKGLSGGSDRGQWSRLP